MADTKISDLSEQSTSVGSKDDYLAIVTGGITKKIKFETLINQTSLAKITTDSGKPIDSDEIEFKTDCVKQDAIEANAVGGSELADNTVIANHIHSSDGLFTFNAGAPGGSDTPNFKGQLWVDTSSSPANKTYIATGTSAGNWAAIEAGTSTISPASASNAIPTLNITATASGNTYTLAGTIPNTTGAKQFVAGPTGAGGAVSARAIVGTDLPAATSTDLGAVKIDGGGLAIDGTTSKLSVSGLTASDIPSLAASKITSGTIDTARIPIATTSAKGGVIVQSGGGLAVDGSGNISISNSITGAQKALITYNADGLVTAGADLAEANIPALSTAKITSGTFPVDRIGSNAINEDKLSDASTTKFQSIAQAGFPAAGAFNGQLLFDTVAEDCYIWDGNAWQAITTLTKGSLVLGGTYNANTSQMATVTTAGSGAGLTVGSNLPTATSTVDGVYVVVATAGTPSSPAPTVALTPPDYILGVTNASGSSWNEIDLSATVSGQIASNVGYSPYGQVSATNCQDAINELETEKMPKAGGTFTGPVEIGAAGSLVFEGSSADGYETTLSVTDPTADRAIVLPNDSGTVILAGKASIVNADVATNAAIDYSKLAALASGKVLIGNGSNVATAQTVSGDITISNAGVAAIGSGVVINADIKSDAAIDYSKLAALTDGNILVGNGSNVATSVTPSGDITLSNAGAFAIASGVIVDADINASAAIAGSKLAAGTTSAVGAVQLEDSVTSTSTTKAATPASVKSVKDSSAQLAGAVFTGPVDLGANTDGHDFRLYGDTSGAYIHWDESADVLKTVGGATIDIVQDKFKIGGTAVTTTAAELNVLDGIPGTLTATELGYVDGVTSAIQTQINAKGDASTTSAQTFTKTQSGTVTTQTTTTGTLTLNLNTSTNNHSINKLTGAFTLANPSAMTAGTSGFIKFTQAASPITPGFGTYWHFPGGSASANLTQTEDAVDLLVYTVVSASSIICDLVKDVKD